MKTRLVIQRLKYLFYIALGIQVILLISVAFKWINLMSDTATVSLTVERYTLLITLISIPGALKLFSIIMKGNKHSKREEETTMLYIKAYTVRFSILILVATMNIFLFALTFNQNFLLLTLTTFTAYIFTYPSDNHLKVTEEEEEEEINNTIY